jgi:NhaA family Na+:H+ antiporter
LENWQKYQWNPRGTSDISMTMAFHAQSGKGKLLPIEVLTSPFVRFAKMEAAGGVLLLGTTLAALGWANSPWYQSYTALWSGNFTVGFGRFVLTETRLQWIDDGLMAIFFFLVGLEIKREILIGELSSLKLAGFPLISAIGGTIVPALFYVALNHGGPAQRGWGIPMATDIAFALGVLVVLGKRVPISLKVFVTALAIVDDILSIVVIAVFYTHEIHWMSLAIGLGGILVSAAANRMGIRQPVIYGLIGLGVWFAVLESGVHATLAGVLLGFTIPAQTYIDREQFLKRSRWLIDRFEHAEAGSFEEQSAVHSLETQCELIEPPLHRIEHRLQPWVGFVVMPLFAFANAGLRIVGHVAEAARHPVTWGVLLGLLLGKPIGISLFAWLSTKLRFATCPADTTWWQIVSASSLCGIGFTMSLFIATLAFGEGNLLNMAKMGTLAASALASICGVVLLTTRSGRARLEVTGSRESSSEAA